MEMVASFVSSNTLEGKNLLTGQILSLQSTPIGEWLKIHANCGDGAINLKLGREKQYALWWGQIPVTGSKGNT